MIATTNNLEDKLKLSMKLWNSIHEKSRILFSTGGRIRCLNTPVWFVSDKHVCICAGIILPISCIIDVMS